MTTNDAEIQDLMAQWRSVMAAGRPRWHAVDMTFTQLRALSVIARRQPVRMSDLADELGAGLAAVSGLVERMVRHSLVTRRTDASDRRSVLLETTPRARRLLDRLERGRMEHFGKLIERMTPAEREALATTMRAFVRLSSDYGLHREEHGLVSVRRRSSAC